MARTAAWTLALLMALPAQAATYTFTGPAYTNATGAYTTSMRVTGSFVTAAPLAANLSSQQIGPLGSNLVTAWSFFDGINTLTNANSSEVNNLPAFSVSTDATGNIVGWDIHLWSPRPPHDLTQSFNGIGISSLSSVAAAAASHDGCATIAPGPPALCVMFIASIDRARAVNPPSPGLWTRSFAPDVPALSTWGLLLLGALLALAGVGLSRRNGSRTVER